jgi:hypothetical protein
MAQPNRLLLAAGRSGSRSRSSPGSARLSPSQPSSVARCSPVSIVPYAFSEVSSLVATASVLGFVGGYLLS